MHTSVSSRKGVHVYASVSEWWDVHASVFVSGGGVHVYVNVSVSGMCACECV